MGGSGPHARQRAVDFDGHWMPVVGRDPIDDPVADLWARAEKAGRDPAAVGMTLFGARPDEAKLAAWRDLGIERVLFALPPAGRDSVLPCSIATGRWQPRWPDLIGGRGRSASQALCLSRRAGIVRRCGTGPAC